MKNLKVLIELEHTAAIEKNAFASLSDPQIGLNKKMGSISDVIKIDESFAPVLIPKIFVREFDPKKAESNLYNTFANFGFDASPQASTYVIRGEVQSLDALKTLEIELSKQANVKGIFADVAIESQLVCPGAGPVGNHMDVEQLLCCEGMRSKGMDGAGVMVAIVDTGVNTAYLNSRGKTPIFDSSLSWSPNPAVTPGSAPVSHGTMCAFDVCIAAPKCTLIDIALLSSTRSGSTVMEGLLSDAVRAYNHLLLNVMGRSIRPGQNRSLVVNNSWGMFHPSWDFPVGHPGNYSSNPNHPFNRIVIALEKAGADILFAAGNCGPECPDGRCQGVTNAGIYGANSSPAVLSVAGVATNLDRIGYSNKGPGLIDLKKPDITGYTHFSGSGVYSADGGTSAACPVVAGVVAAVRTVRPLDPGNTLTSPSAIRNLITSTAKDLGDGGYDYFYGHGIIDGCKLVKKLTPLVIRDICQIYPRICELTRNRDFCDRYPQICEMIRNKFPIPVREPILPFHPRKVEAPKIRKAEEIKNQFAGKLVAAGEYEDVLDEFFALLETNVSSETYSNGNGTISKECNCN